MMWHPLFLPYLLLIALYFFFVNLEARKDTDSNKLTNNNSEMLDDKKIKTDNFQRIKIPVIPYEK